jgi:hypothetical protein
MCGAAGWHERTRSIQTPSMRPMPSPPIQTAAYLEKPYETLLFALPNATAQKQIADHAKNFDLDLLGETAREPVKTKRRIH